jgi:thioredoxin-like negative regulator of GroEL
VGPVLDELARTWASRLRIVKLNVDENPATASKYSIQSIPTLILFKGGKEIDRQVGALPKQAIERWLNTKL